MPEEEAERTPDAKDVEAAEAAAPETTAEAAAAPADAGEAAPEADPLAAARALAERLEAELAAARERELRLIADMENMRRRQAQEATRLRAAVTAEVVRAVLPALDNLERALRAVPAEDDSPLVAGLRLSLQAFEDALGKLGARRLAALGEAFDPARHEALQEEAREGAEPGRILEVYQDGWTLGDVLVRPALVKVAR